MVKSHTQIIRNVNTSFLHSQASTVNMNVMGPVYNMVKHGINSDKTLGISLFIGKCVMRCSAFVHQHCTWHK